MQYRTYGKTGEKVSALGFGCMRLPVVDNRPGKIDFRQASALIHEAIGLGVNYFDTAYTYHEETSEAFLARAIPRSKRHRLLLADKLPSWKVNKPGDAEKLLNEQLKRLNTDYIDFYLLHSLRKSWWDNLQRNDILRFLEKARQEGKIRYIGFSFHDEYDVFREIADAAEWDFCLLQYNYMDMEEQAGEKGVRHAHHKGMGVAVMEPLKGGYLTRCVPEEIQQLLNKKRPGWSPAEWALRWVWNHHEVSVVLSGMGSREELLENVRIAGEAPPGNLDSSHRNILEEVRKTYLSRTVIPCTNCGYCMPCPEGVDIPGIFSIYNHMKIFENPENARANYAFLKNNGKGAENCVECGNCEEVCPQTISIIEKLKECERALG
ncbi:MAG TPA: aldo/keto reductase [Bacteroidetes bacterium]|nr:aldo/keto reductase [Bacteroidota bacterium]